MACFADMRRIHEILVSPRAGDALARAVSIGLLLLIGANVLASVLETEPAVRSAAAGFFRWFEWASVAVFTAEYVLRLWSCVVDPRFAGAVRGRLRMVLTPMALIDLAAIAPFYVELFVPGVIDLRFLRVMRVLRMFRLMRIGHVAEAFATTMQVLQRKRTQLLVSLVVVLVAIFLSAGALYVAEHGHEGTRFTSIPQAMWWSVVTITTIGYGDMVPETPAGKVLGGLVAFIGICAVALPVGIISSGFIEEIGRKRTGVGEAEGAVGVDVGAVARACPHCGGELDG